MKFVTISSMVDITVTNSIGGEDHTNYNSHVGNNLNIAPTWTKCTVDIRKGAHNYPAEIAEWFVVKKLEEQKLITIGRETDEGTDEEKAAAEKFEQTKSLLTVTEPVEPKRRRRRSTEEAETETAE